MSELVKDSRWVTLKGALSVLKAIPGTYFSQTGNPLKLEKTEQKTEYVNTMIFLKTKMKATKEISYKWFVIDLIIYPKFHSAQTYGPIRR